MALNPSAADALARLRKHEVSTREVAEWPGTTLWGGSTAQLTEYSLNAELATDLAALAEGLYDWQQPDLPEDLGFLRLDGSAWLASIAHERDAYFVVSAEEEIELRALLPGVLAPERGVGREPVPGKE